MGISKKQLIQFSNECAKQNKITKLKPHLFGTVGGIELFEHPIYGDEYPVIINFNGIWWSTDYYDPADIASDFSVKLIRHVVKTNFKLDIIHIPSDSLYKTQTLPFDNFQAADKFADEWLAQVSVDVDSSNFQTSISLSHNAGQQCLAPSQNSKL